MSDNVEKQLEELNVTDNKKVGRKYVEEKEFHFV